MIRTFIDAGVLIYAARSQGEITPHQFSVSKTYPIQETTDTLWRKSR